MNDTIILSQRYTLNGKLSTIGSGLVLFGVLIGFVGFGKANLSLLLVALGMLFIAAVLLVRKECIAIDCANKQIHTYNKLLSLKFGKRHDFARFSGIKIMYYYTPATSGRGGATAGGWEFLVYLISIQGEDLKLLYTFDKDNAVEFQKELVMQTGLPILEAERGDGFVTTPKSRNRKRR